jgi:AcrR family transcriptional regulator
VSVRERVLEAAREVFGARGYTGATTRRIATEAGVNEVSLFRLFGTKEALLDEAVRSHITGAGARPLTCTGDPLGELSRWCSDEIERLAHFRTLILQCLAEEPVHPEFTHAGASVLATTARELERWVDEVSVISVVRHPEYRRPAVTMLVAALYSEALGRTTIPEAHRLEPSAAPVELSKTFLHALGVSFEVRYPERHAKRAR